MRDLQSICFSRSCERAALWRKKNQSDIDFGNGAANRIRELLVAHRHSIKRAVRLHVIWLDAGRFADRLENPKFIDDRVEDFAALHRQLFPPKVLAVEQTGMCADSDLGVAGRFN